MNNNIKRRYEVKYPSADQWVPIDAGMVHYIFTTSGCNPEPVFLALRNGETVASRSGSQYREAGHVAIEPPLDYSRLGAEADVSHVLVGMG